MPGEVLIGEPTATIEAYTTAALGASKKIAPTCSFLASKTGTVEAIRWWNAETAAATAVGVGIYADNGSATAPTGLSPVNKAGAALAEGAGTGLVLTAKTWTQVTLGTPLKVTKGVRYWIGLNDIGAGTAVKPATAVSDLHWPCAHGENLDPSNPRDTAESHERCPLLDRTQRHRSRHGGQTRNGGI